MTKSDPIAAESFSVEDNIAPGELSAPTSVSVFTTDHTTLTLGIVVTIDGIQFIPVKSVPNW